MLQGRARMGSSADDCSLSCVSLCPLLGCWWLGWPLCSCEVVVRSLCSCEVVVRSLCSYESDCIVVKLEAGCYSGCEVVVVIVAGVVKVWSWGWSEAV